MGKEEITISLLMNSPKEVRTVANWYFQEWAYKNPEASVQSVVEKLLLSTKRNEIPMAFIAHTEGELSGAGEIKYRTLPEYPEYCYWLDGIYVPLKHRGKGISTRLIEFAKSKAIELKLPALYLRCEAHNVSLYEARDFRVVKREEEKFIMEWNTLSMASKSCIVSQNVENK